MDRILLGVAYYPEHVEESEWPLDAELMAELGLNCIRVGEFCWSRMQRSDGTLTLDWLGRVVELFDRRGIKTILCTPTAAPPVWAAERFPDLSPITPDGRVGLFGGRRHYSVFHEGYRQLSVDIAAALAQCFGQHPGVIGWQIDNEVGSYSIVDCSPPALRAFHRHLKAKYASVDELNRAWGLIFWNQEVERFEQVPAPTEMMTTRSPSHVLEYNRFCLQGMAEYVLLQAQAIKRHASSHQFVTSNCEEAVAHELFRLQRERGQRLIDLACVDNYPELLPGLGRNAMRLDRYRCFDRSKGFVAFELQTGSSYTTTGGLEHAPRRYWAWETLARGGRALVWFHWRRFRSGPEWRHAGLVERDRKKRSVFRSVQEIIREVRRVEPILADARVASDVQVLYSLDNVMARDRASEPIFWLEIQLPDFLRHRYPLWESEVLRAVYNPLVSFGLTLDFVTEHEAWETAKPLIAPDIDICADSLAAKLHGYCEAGGTLICFPGAGERDEFGCNVDTPPGKLRSLFGVSLAEYHPLAAGEGATYDPATGRLTEQRSPEQATTGRVSLNGKSIEVDVRHAEVLDVADAEIRGTYATGPCGGRPAITERRAGKGRAIYLGAVPRAASSAALYRTLLLALTANPVPYRVIKLLSPQGRFAFLLNETAASVPLERRVEDLVTGSTLAHLESFSVALIKR